MSVTPSPQPRDLSGRRFHPRTLLIAAAIWHVIVTVTVLGVGKYQLLPSQIYPNGIARFASDGVFYQDQCVELAAVLSQEGVIAWAVWPTQLHVRLYSLPFTFVSRWISFNILTIEPVNLIYYLLILSLVFKICEAIFDYRSALLAAAIVAVWPSFLLHTTQLLRDPLLIVAVLILVATVVASLRLNISWRKAIVLAVAAAGAIVCVRIVRQPMWYVVCAAVATAILLLIIQGLREKRITAGVIIFSSVLIGVTLITPLLQPWFRNQQELRAKAVLKPERVQQWPVEEQIAARREAFKLRLDERGNVAPAEDGSRIDADIQFHGFRDIIWHVPRAIMVGFFAPFPNMWFRAGLQVGYAGRLISGVETILTYALEGLAVFGLWRARRKPPAWLLMIIICMGLAALGLVVNNIGALYRLRYPFWVLLVILGAGGATHLISRLALRSNSRSV